MSGAVTGPTYADEVARGVEVLDRAYGERWIHNVDLAILDMLSGRLCVVAQLNGGSFTAGWSAIGVPHVDVTIWDDPVAVGTCERWLREHGLVNSARLDLDATHLNRAWCVAIQRLRDERGAA